MIVRLILAFCVFITLISCSESSVPNLCDRVVKETSDDASINKLWIILTDAYDNVGDYEYIIGPESIKITSKREFLTNTDFEFIPIDWDGLGFFYGVNYVLYYPSERMLSSPYEEITDEMFVRSITRSTLKKIEVGNESVRIRFYPEGESFAADVQCGRPELKSSKVFKINAEFFDTKPNSVNQ